MPILNDDIISQTWHRINVYTCEISTIKIIFNTSSNKINSLEKSLFCRLILWTNKKLNNSIIFQAKRENQKLFDENKQKSIKWKMALNNFGKTQKCLGAINLIFSSQTVFQQPLCE